MPTYPLTKPKKLLSSNIGMTLLEILVVLAIIGGVIAIGGTYMAPPGKDIRAHIRDILILTKRLNQKAQLDQKLYRINFSFDPEDPSYFVQVSDKDTIKKKTNDTFDAFNEKEKKSDFKMASDMTKKEKRLPPGFFFKKLILIEQNLYFDEGAGYIHFFPQGMADAAALQITNKEESLAWTLIVDPLTGRAELVDGLYEADQLRRD